MGEAFLKMMMGHHVRNKMKKGQSLVEAIVALAIALIVITGLVVLAVGAVRTATLSKNRSLAVQYAQEGIEALRSIRDRDFSELPASGGPHRLVWTGSEWTAIAGTETITIFKRSFTASEPSGGKLRFDLTVSWVDSGGTHDVDLITYLADWR
jgi:Tfp pilus assembly protein PilV